MLKDLSTLLGTHIILDHQPCLGMLPVSYTILTNSPGNSFAIKSPSSAARYLLLPLRLLYHPLAQRRQTVAQLAHVPVRSCSCGRLRTSPLYKPLPISTIRAWMSCPVRISRKRANGSAEGRSDATRAAFSVYVCGSELHTGWRGAGMFEWFGRFGRPVFRGMIKVPRHHSYLCW